jgi:hypothetical protein
MYMAIEDEDVVDNQSEYILIDSLTIYEDESVIPTYKVTLRERRKVSYKGTPSATSQTSTKPVSTDTDSNVNLAGYATEELVNSVNNRLSNRIGVVENWFEWADEEHTAIRTRYNFFSDKEIASGAVGQEGSGGGGSGGGSGSIGSASDVKLENLTGGDILVYDKDSTFWKNRPMTYFHPQNNAAEVWIIKHDLGKYPNVKILDSQRIQVFGDVQYLDENRVKVTFGGAFSGTAYLD